MSQIDELTYNKKVLSKYISYDKYKNYEQNLNLPLGTQRLKETQKLLRNFILNRSINSMDYISKIDFSSDCKPSYDSGYKNCDKMSEYIYQLLLITLDLYLDEHKEIIINNNKDKIEIIRSYLQIMLTMIGRTSLNMMIYLNNLKNYLNTEIQREFIKIGCPKCDEDINYTCGRGNIFIDSDSKGIYFIVFSNTVSKDDDEVKYYGIVDLNTKLEQCKSL